MSRVLLAGVIEKFAYLKIGLSVVLIFVGAKMVLMDVIKIPIAASLSEALTGVDAVAVVSAPPDVQRQRVLERPGMTLDKLEALIAKQMPDAEKRRRADFVVDTSDGLDPVRAQIKDILAAVVKMPQRRT